MEPSGCFRVWIAVNLSHLAVPRSSTLAILNHLEPPCHADRALSHTPQGATILGRADVRIARSLVGSYITSLEMAGCSITLLGVDQKLLALFDAPVCAPALRNGSLRALTEWIREFAKFIAAGQGSAHRSRRDLPCLPSPRAPGCREPVPTATDLGLPEVRELLRSAGIIG